MEGCAYGAQPGEESEGGEEFSGIYYSCEGELTARLDAGVCNSNICAGTTPLPEFTILVNYGPFFDEQDLDVSKSFFAELPVDPPDVGACCVEESSSGSVVKVAGIDCAARACRSAQVQMNQLVLINNLNVLGLEDIPFVGAGVVALHSSLQFHRDTLADPATFTDCINTLHDGGIFATPEYMPENGRGGTVRRIEVQNFNCMLNESDCAVATDMTGETIACTENPNWFPGVAGIDYIDGTVEPNVGSVTLTPGEGPAAPIANAFISYRRHECEGETCTFVLTELTFNIPSDVSIGPIVFHSPSASLLRSTMGSYGEKTVTFPPKKIVLTVTASVSFAGNILFNGAEIPMTVSNIDAAKIEFDSMEFAVVDANFAFPLGASGELVTAPALCNED